MVCGVTVLIGVLSAQRGIDLFTDLLARLATQNGDVGDRVRDRSGVGL